MVRIRSDRIGQEPIGELPEKVPPLGGLPSELPPPSSNQPSPVDVASLFLAEGRDLSRVPTQHPLSELFRKLWLKVTLQALSSASPPQKEP